MYFKLNGLGNKSVADFVQALAALPAGVTSLDLSANSLDYKSSDELAKAFKALPAGVTSLHLSGNNLHKNSAAKLAKIFEALPAGVTSVHLSSNNLPTKSGHELEQVFYLSNLLNSYLQERTAVTYFGVTKEYFYRSFFSIFQKSFTKKKNAVFALKSALNGENVDLSEHLSTLRNGNLGKKLRKFIKAKMGDGLVDERVHTLSDFVHALQKKNSNTAELIKIGFSL